MPPTFLPRPVDQRPQGFLRLLGGALRRPGGRRGMSVLTLVLLVAGVGLFAYPVATDFWAHREQGSLRAELKVQFSSPTYRYEYEHGDIPVGEGLTELSIPALKVDTIVVQGTTLAALDVGAGHYVNTPLPGQRGNVGIAGHRTTFGRPFNQLNEMVTGDTVVLTTPFAAYTYRVVSAFDGHANPWVVLPDDVSVVAQTGDLGTGHWLTLTTCNPKGSAAQRLVLRLTLVKTVQLTAAVSPPGGTNGSSQP